MSTLIMETISAERVAPIPGLYEPAIVEKRTAPTGTSSATESSVAIPAPTLKPVVDDAALTEYRAGLVQPLETLRDTLTRMLGKVDEALTAGRAAGEVEIGDPGPFAAQEAVLRQLTAEFAPERLPLGTNVVDEAVWGVLGAREAFLFRLQTRKEENGRILGAHNKQVRRAEAYAELQALEAKREALLQSGEDVPETLDSSIRALKSELGLAA